MVEAVEAKVQAVLTPALRHPTTPALPSSRPKVINLPVAPRRPPAQAQAVPGPSRLPESAEWRLETRVFALASASQIESAYYPVRLERGLLLDAIA